MGTTKDVMETMYAKLDNFLKTETVIGEPIDLGKIKLIPIITASFGLGGGVGEESSKGAGGGGGLGCKISPDAILVVSDTEVRMIHVKNKGPLGGTLDKLIEQVPDLVDKIDLKKLKKDKKEEKVETEKAEEKKENKKE